jgi:hypothetical protein
MLTATCHCGAVRLEVPEPPPFLVLCNCSICRRNGALWAFYEAGAMRIEGREHEVEYVFGPKTIRTMHCRHCGCVTHWERLVAKPGMKYGVNMRNFEPADVGDARLRRFDGADTWTYLDE